MGLLRPPPSALPLALLSWAALASGVDEGQAAKNETWIPAQGDCSSGVLPRSCEEGDLGNINWEGYLGILCQREVERVVIPVITHALSMFDAESAKACFVGFIATLLALLMSGAGEWQNQIVRFMPDGSSRVLTGIWDDRPLDPVFKQFTITLPATMTFSPPFPPWYLPGPLKFLRQAQDMSQLQELPRELRCNPQALQLLDCKEPFWMEFLYVLCVTCAADSTSGLPCLYGEELLAMVRAVLDVSRDPMRKHACPHGLLAAILAMSGRADLSLPDADGAVYRVPLADGGPPRLVVNAAFRQVLKDPRNYFALNVPIIDLAPFPLHAGIVRSARINAPKEAAYYHDFLAAVSRSLARLGIAHALVPGDASVGPWRPDVLRPAGGLSSFFVDYQARAHVESAASAVLEALSAEFGGPWRWIQVSEGLWQVGEEPYRFAPHAGIPYRAFCEECISTSIYFYMRDGLEALLPLAHWTPCVIPLQRIFPTRLADVAGTAVPHAADTVWLRRAQRHPVIWIPDEPSSSSSSSSCRDTRLRLTRQYGAADLFPAAQLAGEFDLSSGVHHDLGLFDLMRLREDSEKDGLRRYSDKVLFKSRLRSEGIPIPKVFHLSNHSPDVMDILLGLETTRFVAKPTHLAATSFVFAMCDGVNLVSGEPASISDVANGLAEAWYDKHVDDWATESTPPGVIIEELIEAPERTSGQGSTPDELKCQTFFGELLFCEWVFVRNMTTGEDGVDHFHDAHLAGDRALPSRGHQAFGIPNFASKGYIFKDGSCFDCVEPVPLSSEGWAKLIEIVERVAAGTDHIRIDVFVTPQGEPVVNEANISFLKISKFPPALVEEMRRRWLDGYRAWHS